MIAVIGDGAMSAGMAHEAMNNAGAMHSRLIVILNDNDMSIAPPVGAMSSYLARLVSGGTYRGLRETAKQLAKKLPKFFYEKAARAEEVTRGFWTGGTMFEEMGFYYVGPIDGHNLDHLLPVLKKRARRRDRGRSSSTSSPRRARLCPRGGFRRQVPRRRHLRRGDGRTGEAEGQRAVYTKVFGESLIKEARKDDRIVAITAAMPSGTGIDLFAKQFPSRTFDVGIAEQHAVTFAAGLAAEGYKPFCAIYSTFLQRAYDQVVHDVAIQRLPVRFALDRAGLVGADGPTHAGSSPISAACPTSW